LNKRADTLERAGPESLEACAQALGSASRLLGEMMQALRRQLAAAHPDPAMALQLEQARAHGVAWAATYVRALGELHAWAARLEASKQLGRLELLLLRAAFSEYLAQLSGGLPLSQGEMFRAETLEGMSEPLAAFRGEPAVRTLLRKGFDTAARREIADQIGHDSRAHPFGDVALGDSVLEEIRVQVTRFADDHAQQAHGWHLGNELIPDAVLQQMADMGIFGLTIDEAYGGAGLGKTAMCVATEALARAHIGLGSLGTRCEIAGELILRNGTEAQKARLLPLIASGEMIPTASFTEPDTGSDLGALSTRAVRDAEGWVVHGNKTWTTHGARSDLMTLLVRTAPGSTDYRGLSMFLAEKPRGTDAQPFPAAGMQGGEIHVLGYRGMKEYEISFDGFRMPHDGLLGGKEGAGSNADNAVQVHGGNGYALEYPISRVLCDARILNVFEGAAEIQANIVIRGLLAQ
jgi:(2S)-methylsuccinyl-CoA dehydrogenase